MIDDIKFVNSTEHYMLIIQYARGSAGNLVQRIIGVDSKYYWDKEINNCPDEGINPLQWPVRSLGFRLQDSKISREKQYSACHTGYCNIFDETNNKDIIKNIQLMRKAIKNKQKLIMKTDYDIRSFNKNVSIVRVIGTPVRKVACAKSLNPVIEDNTFNLYIEKLISNDYDIFIKEYLQLCGYLDIEPKVKAVRNFIDIWLERQK
jgi:hypothetical protein